MIDEYSFNSSFFLILNVKFVFNRRIYSLKFCDFSRIFKSIKNIFFWWELNMIVYNMIDILLKFKI